MDSNKQQASIRTTLISLLALIAGMVMLVSISPTLYRLFCDATGYGGTTRRASEAPQQVLNIPIEVHFNGDIMGDLPMTFKPGEQDIIIKVGEERLTHYEVENLSDKPLSVRATYNVLPDAMGLFLNKTQCFCFDTLTLAPRQRASLPISFFIDPASQDDKDARDIRNITLSYTFFQAKDQPITDQNSEQSSGE